MCGFVVVFNGIYLDLWFFICAFVVVLNLDLCYFLFDLFGTLIYRFMVLLYIILADELFIVELWLDFFICYVNLLNFKLDLNLVCWFKHLKNPPTIITCIQIHIFFYRSTYRRWSQNINPHPNLDFTILT